jgi:hypothetical protein
MSELAQLEEQQKNANQLIELKKAAIRLSINSDFKTLFQKGYFLEEAARMVQLASDPSLTKEQREDANDMAKATGHAKRYLSMIVQMAAVAERDIEELEAAIVEAREAEDAANQPQPTANAAGDVEGGL